MAINWRIVTLMLVNLALFLCLITAFLNKKHLKQLPAKEGPVSLQVTDRGAASRRSLAYILAPAAASCQVEISPEVGSYVLGTNPLGRFFPRYIYFRDSSANGLKLALVVRNDAILQVSVLKGSIRYGGLVYHEDGHRILTVKRGENFWLGQSEIKVR